MRFLRAGSLVALGCILLLRGVDARLGTAATTTPPAAPAPVPPEKAEPAPQGSWAEVDRLIGEQKLEQASGRIEALLAGAERRGDEAAWARALIRATDVRIALGGFETAVRQLREARWPSGVLARTGLDLYYEIGRAHV